MKKYVVTAAALLILVSAVFLLPRETYSNKIRIGVADDSSEVIFKYMEDNKSSLKFDINKEFETFGVKDCCSSKSQWALSSGKVDISIMCPSSAEALVKKDHRFKIISPLILNSDIFVIKKGTDANKIKKIGVSTNRTYQNNMVKDKFGNNCQAVPMLYSSLPYALEKGIVDGILTDYAKAEQLEGDKYSSYSGIDNVNYVLVTSKEFEKDSRYKEFIAVLKEAVDKLNQSQKEVELWNKYRIKFTLTIPKEAL